MIDENMIRIRVIVEKDKKNCESFSRLPVCALRKLGGEQKNGAEIMNGGEKMGRRRRTGTEGTLVCVCVSKNPLKQSKRKAR